ncbi:MAG: translocation/assembly module TamB domain-containing protein [Kofleriaceae bacterium]
MKRAWKIVRRVLIGLIVLVAIALILIHTPPGKRFVRGRVEAKLAERVNGTVSIDEVDYGFLFNHIELKHLVIRDAAGRDAVVVGALHVVPDRMSLVHGTPVIEDLAVDGVIAKVVQAADGTTNLSTLFKPSTQPPPASITVTKLHLGGSAQLRRADGTTVSIDALAVDAAVSAKPLEQIVDATASVTAQITLETPGAPKKLLALALGKVAVQKRGLAVDATIDQLGFGALSIEQVHAKLDVDGKKLIGDQAIVVTKGRIDRAKLQTLLGRQAFVDDVLFDLSLTGPADKLVAHGDVASRGASLVLDGTFSIADPALPTYDVTLVGKGASEDLITGELAPGIADVSTDVKLAVKGQGVVPPDVDATVALDVGPTKIGKIVLDGAHARAHARKGGVTLESFDAKGLGFTLAATGDIASDAQLHGSLTVTGKPAEAVRVLREAGLAVWYRVPPIPNIAITVTAAGKVDGELALEVKPTALAVAGGSISLAGTATLDHEVVRDAASTVTISHVDIASLMKLAHKPPPKVNGSISGKVALTRTAASQRATYDLTVALRKPDVVAAIHGAADLNAADVSARLTAGSMLLATAKAHVTHDDKGLLPNGPWKVTVDAPAHTFAELVALAPKPIELPPDLSGDVSLHAELAGSPAKPRGTIDTTIHAQTAIGPQTVVAHSVIAPGAVTTKATVGDLATIEAVAHLPASLFAGREPAIAAIKRALSVDATIDLPDRDLSTLPNVPPKLLAVGGRVGGKIVVSGTPAAPKFSASLRWTGYTLANGSPGETKIDLAGTREKIDAMIDHGPLAIAAQIDVGKIEPGVKPPVSIVARIHAPPTSLLALVPKPLLPDLHGADIGTFESDLKITAKLPDKDIALDGGLALRNGSFEKNGRKLSDITVELAGDHSALKIVGISAHEGDRTFAAHGSVALDHGKPTTASLDLALHHWLVLGSGSPLFSDAPIGTVDLAAQLTADLTQPIAQLDATIASVDFQVPDRLDRSHQPEWWAENADVLYDSPTPGKLPVAPPATEAHPSLPLDVRVHIPQPIHALKSPIDVMAKGELTVTVRPETGVVTRGTLDVTGGKLVLFGRDHAVQDGTLAFTDEHPHGWFDLHFAHPLPPEATRELEPKSEPTKVALSGPPTKPNLTMGGAFNSTLEELLAMYHDGHPVFFGEPGLYPSSTAEVPRGEQFLIFGYLSNALPHFLFLDRVAAWADPAEPRGSYGRIRNLDAARYADDRKARVRVVGRPTVPGRSTAELQLDHLWVDTSTLLVGAGLRAGDRFGGGLGLFVEWSK